MSEQHIPNKHYFTIGEVSTLCSIKPHVLRYWEQEFAELKPVRRRGQRRYYTRLEVQLVRRIKDLLYDKGFTISGARQQLKMENNSAPEMNSESVVEQIDQAIAELNKVLDTLVVD
jgi:DNA-binding transcriptional MerR regulator